MTISKREDNKMTNGKIHLFDIYLNGSKPGNIPFYGYIVDHDGQYVSDDSMITEKMFLDKGRWIFQESVGFILIYWIISKL